EQFTNKADSSRIGSNRVGELRVVFETGSPRRELSRSEHQRIESIERPRVIVRSVKIDRARSTAELRPIGCFSAKDICKLLFGQGVNRVVPIDDDSDSVHAEE